MSANVLIKEYLNTRVPLLYDIANALAQGNPPGWKRMAIHFAATDPKRFSESIIRGIEINHYNDLRGQAEEFMDRIGGYLGYTVSVFAKGLAECGMVSTAIALYPELPQGKKLTSDDVVAFAVALKSQVIGVSLDLIYNKKMHPETKLNNNEEDALTLSRWIIQHQYDVKDVFNAYAKQNGLSAWLIA